MPIRDLSAADAPRCDEIIAALPTFFGVESGIQACAEAVRTQRGWAAELDGVVVGFLTVEQLINPEISWMAVHPAHRHCGFGKALVSAAVDALVADGCTLLTVLTLGPSVVEKCADNYAGTRRFYRSVGFQAVRELDLADWEYPALLMSRQLRQPRSTVVNG
ncbi:GNAT family N-acetyltransferase [Kutzneria buriramensis]|uniref:Ribosomal protein S18 acetylase RimI-like enzyme n=1 Tax=Kutzneria buriramensis TaxID=1045776 RepID=A0A3E0HDG3_9PSEU|nr:GNAT family N-acetyltransferase [Kutzneria buriramensis]REH42848.1 ribosomal protein S18 acetylase RimI-like enzyme [Kutzneria buriramensis]